MWSVDGDNWQEGAVKNSIGNKDGRQEETIKEIWVK